MKRPMAPNGHTRAWRLAAILQAALVVSLARSAADTVYMRNGVQVHGTITSEGAQTTLVKVGSRTITLRTDEVLRTERNDKTGVVDRRRVAEAAAERDRALTAETGLNSRQRAEVTALLGGLIAAEDTARSEAARKLIAMGGQVDVFRFLAHSLPMMLPRYVPGVLDILAAIDPKAARAHVRAQSSNVDPECRAKAMQLIGRLGDNDAADLLVRGLADEHIDVRAQAAVSLGILRARDASDLLLDGLSGPEVRMANACRSALTTIWEAEVGGSPPHTAQQWQEWLSQQGVQPVRRLSDIEPLAPHGTRFIDE